MEQLTTLDIHDFNELVNEMHKTLDVEVFIITEDDPLFVYCTQLMNEIYSDDELSEKWPALITHVYTANGTATGGEAGVVSITDWKRYYYSMTMGL